MRLIIQLKHTFYVLFSVCFKISLNIFRILLKMTETMLYIFKNESSAISDVIVIACFVFVILNFHFVFSNFDSFSWLFLTVMSKFEHKSESDTRKPTKSGQNWSKPCFSGYDLICRHVIKLQLLFNNGKFFLGWSLLVGMRFVRNWINKFNINSVCLSD